MCPPETQNAANPNSLGNMRASQRRSVYFSKDDKNMEVPSLPVDGLIEELRARHGKSRVATDFLAAVEEADKNGDGLISIPELVVVLETMQTVKKENVKLHKYLCAAAGVLTIFLLAIFGLVFAVVQLTKETATGDNAGHENALVNVHTGVIVDTHPSDGGGIFLHMTAFTEPLNVTFPSFEDKTYECVGQISEDQVVDHYDQFTVGGSDMTIRYKDYSINAQPLTYVNIPATTIEVTGHDTSSDAGDNAAAATAEIKDSMALDGDTRKRKLTEAGRRLQNTRFEAEVGATGSLRRLQTTCTETCASGIQVCAGAFSACVATFLPEVHTCGACPTGGSSLTIRTDIPEASCEASFHCLLNGRRMQEQEELTVSDYMEGFAAKKAGISFMKDSELTEDVYYVCHAMNIM